MMCIIYTSNDITSRVRITYARYSFGKAGKIKHDILISKPVVCENKQQIIIYYNIQEFV